VSPTAAPLGLGVVGAGRFAAFLMDAVQDLPGVQLRHVADLSLEKAQALAGSNQAKATDQWRDLLNDDGVDAIVVATPPITHAPIALAGLRAGRHVFCEKPLATEASDAVEVADVALRAHRALVVDHVLRYNPILRALTQLGGALLGPVQRFCFENDASDENLFPDHWFWDETQSGGIFVEHGVHFFDAAHLLVGSAPVSIQAMVARRDDDGVVDLVSATARHPGGVLASHTHGFTHASRCERQLMRLDHGTAEVRVDGWIPVHAVIDAWTDDAGTDLVEGLPARAAELLYVEGFRLGAGCAVSATVHRDANSSSQARGRGAQLTIPHHARIELTLGGAPASGEVYAESVRAAMADLIRCAASGNAPASGGAEGAAAVIVAAGARQAAAASRTVQLADDIATPNAPVRTA
jgi:predicted dehydrogenase